MKEEKREPRKERNSARNFSIGSMYYSEGLSQKEIAERVGLSQRQVSNIVRTTEEAKQAYEKAIREQYELLELSTQRHKELIESEDEKVALGAVGLNFKNCRVSPSHTTENIYINKILQDNRSVSVSPEMLAVIGEHIKKVCSFGDKSLLINKPVADEQSNGPDREDEQ